MRRRREVLGGRLRFPEGGSDHAQLAMDGAVAIRADPVERPDRPVRNQSVTDPREMLESAQLDGEHADLGHHGEPFGVSVGGVHRHDPRVQHSLCLLVSAREQTPADLEREHLGSHLGPPAQRHPLIRERDRTCGVAELERREPTLRGDEDVAVHRTRRPAKLLSGGDVRFVVGEPASHDRPGRPPQVHIPLVLGLPEHARQLGECGHLGVHCRHITSFEGGHDRKAHAEELGGDIAPAAGDANDGVRVGGAPTHIVGPGEDVTPGRERLCQCSALAACGRQPDRVLSEPVTPLLRLFVKRKGHRQPGSHPGTKCDLADGQQLVRLFQQCNLCPVEERHLEPGASEPECRQRQLPRPARPTGQVSRREERDPATCPVARSAARLPGAEQQGDAVSVARLDVVGSEHPTVEVGRPGVGERVERGTSGALAVLDGLAPRPGRGCREVVGRDGRKPLAVTFAGCGRQYVAHPPMQLGAAGDAEVIEQDATEQGMGEPEPADPRFGHDARVHRPGQGGQYRVGGTAVDDGEKGGIEHGAGYGGDAEQFTGVIAEGREALVQDRSHRWRHADRLLIQVGLGRCDLMQQLGGEQRVTPGPVVQAIDHTRARDRSGDQFHKLSQVGRVEALQVHNRGVAAQLGKQRTFGALTDGRDDQHRHGADDRRQETKHAPCVPVGPLEIVHHQDGGLASTGLSNGCNNHGE